MKAAIDHVDWQMGLQMKHILLFSYDASANMFLLLLDTYDSPMY